MSMRAAGIMLATAFVVAGCGGTQTEAPEMADVEEETADRVTGAGEAAEEQEQEPEEQAEEPTEESEPEPTASDDAATDGGEATVLHGRVGTEEDPEAFVITLTDESGAEVTELPAGDYVIEVTDPAPIHNFHLMGGSVDEATSVPEMEEETWEVTLEPGEYTYTCDAHPPMTGTFTVTG